MKPRTFLVLFLLAVLIAWWAGSSLHAESERAGLLTLEPIGGGEEAEAEAWDEWADYGWVREVPGSKVR